MGGKSKASTSSASTQSTTNQTHADYSTGDGDRTTQSINGSGNFTQDGLVNAGSGSNVSVTLTDQGAVAGAFDVAKDSVGKALGFGSDALNFAGQAGQSALDAVSKSVSATQAMAASSERNNADTVSKVLSLAESVKTGGQAQATRLIAGVVVALIVGGVAVAFIVNKK